MKPKNHLVVFALDEWRFAVHLPAVERVVRAVEVTPLPHAPDALLGVVNVQGRIVPVLNVRKLFGLPERDIGLKDHFIIACALTWTVALAVDAVHGVVECATEEVVMAERILPHLAVVAGVIKDDDGMILIKDVAQFLSSEERKGLEDVLNLAGDGQKIEQ